jgi:hypothetical protein
MSNRVEKRVEVETYSGYKADERPVRVKIDGATIQVAEVEDRWYSPGATFFRVLLAKWRAVRAAAGGGARGLGAGSVPIFRSRHVTLTIG